MILARRVLLLLALMFWQGGFVFYGAVVVPVGADILGSHSEQGWITQVVTNYLNAAGGVALLLWTWEFLAGSDRSRLHGGMWLALVLALGLQVGLHLAMDGLLDAEQRHVHDRPAFRRLHSAYLLVSTAQWAAAMVLLMLTLAMWRRQDALASRPCQGSGKPTTPMPDSIGSPSP